MSADFGVASLLAFNAALLLAILSPGPSLLFLIRQTLTQGRRTGVLTALGLAVMAALWTLAALLGLQTLFALFPWAYLALKSLGALYLIWLAVQMWRHAARPLITGPLPSSDRRAFLSGMMVNLANPKSVVFSAAVLVVIFPAHLSGLEKGLILINHLAVELLIQPTLALLLIQPTLALLLSTATLALLLSTATIRARYLGFKPILDRAAGGILGFLGLRLLLEK